MKRYTTNKSVKRPSKHQLHENESSGFMKALLNQYSNSFILFDEVFMRRNL